MSLVQKSVDLFRRRAIRKCEAKAVEIGARLNLSPVANVGGGFIERWPAAVVADALRDPDADFNTKPLLYRSQTFDLVVCEQVIEHLHNTTFFVSELNRILKYGGHLLLATENLASLPNIISLLVGRSPFSTQPICGRYVGGWRDRSYETDKDPPVNHPTYSGVKGHVRVMTCCQLRALFERAGFELLAEYGFGLNHYVLFHFAKIFRS